MLVVGGSKGWMLGTYARDRGVGGGRRLGVDVASCVSRVIRIYRWTMGLDVLGWIGLGLGESL